MPLVVYGEIEIGKRSFGGGSVSSLGYVTAEITRSNVADVESDSTLKIRSEERAFGGLLR